MPSNIEIKARVADADGLMGRAGDLADSGPVRLGQLDTFFCVPRGRLKLREISPETGVPSAELIFYERPDQAGPKQSSYLLTPVADPVGLKAALSPALGVRGVVRKLRTLYLAGQTRIHIDRVENLGWYMELEVVLREGQSAAEGQTVAADLMRRLGIDASDLIEGAYLDLIARPEP